MIDRSGELGPAADQGNRSTCLAFATTAGHVLARVTTQGLPGVPLSEEALYHLAKKIDGDSLPGTTPDSVGRALSQTGQPEVSRWPYDVTLSDINPLPTPPTGALDPAALRRASMVAAAVDFEDLVTALSAGSGVVLGIDLWPGAYTPAGDTLETPFPADLLGEGHAVLLAGADEQNRRLLLRNSWGSTWGAGGYAWIAERTWERVRLGAWIVQDDLDLMPI